MPDFKSPGAAMTGALHKFLAEREAQRMQSMIDGLSVENVMRQQARADMEMQLRQQAEARAQAEAQQRAQEAAARVRTLDDNRVAAAARRDSDQNTARNLDAINASVADAIASGQVNPADPSTANTMRAKYLANGLSMPSEVNAMLTPAKPEAPVKFDVREHDGDLVQIDPSTGAFKVLRHGRPKPTNGDGSGNAKPPTQGQLTADTFYGRATAASKVVNAVESQVGNWDLASPDFLNFARSDAGQAYIQGKRQWVEAYLRKDSGAAIGKDEFANADSAYFPQIGDSPATRARKRQARSEVEETLRLQGTAGASTDRGNGRSKYRVVVE